MKNIDCSKFLAMSPEELRKKQWTNGLPLSIVGIFVYIALVLTGHKPKDYMGICPYFEVGKGWGGFEMGWFFVCGKDTGTKTKNHEIGHMIQNATVGGFKMLAYSVVSMARYWWSQIATLKTPYYSWFFEKDASRIGDEYVKNITEKQEK